MSDLSPELTCSQPCRVGALVGLTVGLAVGFTVGFTVGVLVGVLVGLLVGAARGHQCAALKADSGGRMHRVRGNKAGVSADAKARGGQPRGTAAAAVIKCGP